MSVFESPCRTLVSALGRKWTWDDRFEAAVVSFKVDEQAGVLAAVEKTLPTAYTLQSIGTATPAVQTAAKRLGGLRGEQRLLAAESGDALLFGAWWPWGDGKTVSLRVGVLGGATVAELRGWFGV